MEINKAKETYIIKTKFQIDDENYVVLREPSAIEIKEFGDDGQNNIELIMNILPDCIIEHTFTIDGKPAKNKDVAEFIQSSVSLYTRLVKQWMNEFVIDDKKKES